MSQESPLGSTQAGLAQLNERSREIFRQIVESYLATGEPVGSRNLARIIPMTLSPASVRNVMADLEQLGLIGGGPEANNPQLTEFADDFGYSVELKPGETASLLGKGELANGGDGKWTGRKPGKYLVRLTLATRGEKAVGTGGLTIVK